MKPTTQPTTKSESDHYSRNRSTGRYSYQNRFERLCVCGRTLGVHDAEAPHGFGDYALDEREGLPDCERFKPAKVAKPKA